ncbi:MAG: hypothetical protein AB7R89_14480 [Dehalococcoidia bacterium]
MDFIAGTTYQNASGQFLVLRVDASTLQVEYMSGPQAGKVLTKRTADMGKLTTTEGVAHVPAAPDAGRRRRPAK